MKKILSIHYELLLQVRRAQLQKLLEDEYKMYELELNSLGKAFYIKRS